MWKALLEESEPELAKAFVDYDWLSLGRDCATQLVNAYAIITSQEFAAKLDSVLTTTKLKLGSGGMIYYTGYVLLKLPFAPQLQYNC